MDTAKLEQLKVVNTKRYDSPDYMTSDEFRAMTQTVDELIAEVERTQKAIDAYMKKLFEMQDCDKCDLCEDHHK